MYEVFNSLGKAQTVILQNGLKKLNADNYSCTNSGYRFP